MKSDDFMDSMSHIDDKLISDAEKLRKGKAAKKSRLWVKLVAAAACISLIVTGIVFVPRYLPMNNASDGSNSGVLSIGSKYLLAKAVYPEAAEYPDIFSTDDEQYDAWFDVRRENIQTARKYSDKMIDFCQSTAKEILDSNGENKVYSPLNVYFALSILAETTDGESREQILKLLGSDKIENVRTTANEIWNAQYKDDKTGLCVLANSLWLSDSYSDFKEDTLKTVAENYYASSFSGNMTDENFNKARQEWVNAQTGGLLKESADNLKFSPQTVMNLTSTINYQVRWQDEFSSENTYEEAFHAKSGDINCDFMHRSMLGSYYWGDGFAAVTLSLSESGNMWLILPDEGVTTEELLQKGDALKMIGDGEYKNTAYPLINLSVPKFDIMSNVDLTENLKKVGVEDIFDFNKSDFSPLTDEALAITSAEHAARVAIDEQGITASAYMSLDYAGAGMPQDEVDFDLNRPFLFVITGLGDTPLFIGVVNQP